MTQLEKQTAFDRETEGERSPHIRLYNIYSVGGMFFTPSKHYLI